MKDIFYKTCFKLKVLFFLFFFGHFSCFETQANKFKHVLATCALFLVSSVKKPSNSQPLLRKRLGIRFFHPSNSHVCSTVYLGPWGKSFQRPLALGLTIGSGLSISYFHVQVAASFRKLYRHHFVCANCHRLNGTDIRHPRGEIMRCYNCRQRLIVSEDTIVFRDDRVKEASFEGSKTMVAPDPWMKKDVESFKQKAEESEKSIFHLYNDLDEEDIKKVLFRIDCVSQCYNSGFSIFEESSKR